MRSDFDWRETLIHPEAPKMKAVKEILHRINSRNFQKEVEFPDKLTTWRQNLLLLHQAVPTIGYSRKIVCWNFVAR